MADFDNACAEFTMTMQAVANWKHIYFGSVYSTRLESAIKDAETAIARMKIVLDKDRRGVAAALRAEGK